MPSVGQQIREQRLRLGLKLEEISARSRIPLRALQGIEDDNPASISSPFLYRSFARQFAESLKLDPTALFNDIEAAALAMPQPRIPGEEDVAKAKVAPLRIRTRPRSFRWLYSVGSLGCVLVGCSSLYGILQNTRASWLSGLIHASSTADRKRSDSAPQPVSAPTANSAPQSAAGGKQAQGAGEAGAPVSAHTESSSLHVEVSAIERTWLTIVEDGTQTFNGILDADQTKVLEGHDTARIRTGNAGGLNCIFNGRSIGPLGEHGQVRTVVFTKTNYEVLDQPTPVALLRLPVTVE